MEYNETIWIDNETPVNAKNMNNIDHGVKTLSNEISILSGQLRGKNLTLEGVNNRYLEEGFYSILPTVASTILGFTTVYGCNVIVSDFNRSGYPTQFISSTKASMGVYVRQFDGDASTWIVSKQATTDKIDISLPLTQGYSEYTNAAYTSKIVKNSLKEATLYLAIKKTDGTKFVANRPVLVATLPSGFISAFGCGGGGFSEPEYGACAVAIINASVYAIPTTTCTNIICSTPYQII